ncbi:thiamine pyrophosphate-dependent dehydrogenase E1 component subunit alpha [Paenibacillus thermoaerophilus]|uniref:2-oxoisovalerate dehydrogenase subunit alpha n=1 Tax=Paenibacillus thermoaerophilus TaxID=1215385 RepID=A0ABW2V623_9BACL|nr:thiamine pyrophosphate-dependent dehydrogenase E1 component subunit alpha [Paenibacillus thermoaerophilus]TMV11998.1 thiamine pyrophosphate-dependent dehydrogenase E1 component subunit alpha [Paenibacillus thermoaerophilus]
MSIGQMSKHRELGLTDEQVVKMYGNMVAARKFDERATLLQRAGKVPFHVSGIGQEAAQTAAAFAMNREIDYFLPYYRDYAFVYTLGMTMRELMLNLFAKAEDPNSAGRQMVGHFGCKRLRVVTGSSPVTTQVPHAAGIAYAAKLRGEKCVAYVSFGEGSSNQGDFHEGANFIGVHKLPVILFCENNQYAISVPYSKQVGTAKIADRALGYGFKGLRVDGNDPLEVYRVVKEARERALAGEGATLIEAMMYRLSPHSAADNDMLYRTREEVEEHRKRDGILRMRAYLTECGLWDDDRENELQERIKAEVNEATAYADKAPYPSPEDTLLHVYGD